MATAAQQAANIFREELEEAWKRHRSQEQAILKSVEEAMGKVKEFLEAVQDAAAKITKIDIDLEYSKPEFNLRNESITQAYNFSNRRFGDPINIDHSIELTFYRDNVFYGDDSFPPQNLSRLFDRLKHELLEIFSPK